MKKIFTGMLAAGMLAGCAQNDHVPTQARNFTFNIAVDAFGAATRSAVNYGLGDYFSGWSGGLENISVDFNGTTQNHTWSDGVLVPTSSPFEFPAGGASVDIEVRWPTPADRKDIGSAERKDQRTRERFLAEDWLRAEMRNVMPAYSVSIFMKHERAKISFALTGALSAAAVEEFTFGDFKAWCHNGAIELMIDPSTDAALFTAGAAGTIKTAEKNYVYTLDAPVAAIEAGGCNEIILNL